MNILILTLGAATVALSAIAMLALRRARQAGARCADLEGLLLDAAARLDSIEAQMKQRERTDARMSARLDRLTADQSRAAAHAGRPGFGEAIALIEHGAGADQLMASCGIGRAEARLVETLYGKRKNAAEADARNKFVLVDTQPEAVEFRCEA